MRQSESGRRERSKRAFNNDYFTLYVGFPSTKKHALKLAIGVRAGTAVARNRAKRLAREAFRLNRHQLPVGIEMVIAARKGIGALNRRSLRSRIIELFEYARRLSPPSFSETIRPDDTSERC